MDISPGTRASTAEREHVVNLLSGHLADGRIDLAEYDRRVAHVYETATRDDIDTVLADLPASTVDLSKPASEPSRRVPLWQRIEIAAWLAVGVLNVLIWGAVSIGVGEWIYPWPIWVIGPWGLVLAFRLVTGFESQAATGTRDLVARLAAPIRA